MSIKRETLILFAAVTLLLAALLALGTGCAVSGARDRVLASTAATVASGYRLLGKVDMQRQTDIRTMAKFDAPRATRALDEHLKRYDAADKALGVAADLLTQVDQLGLTAALMGPLAKAGADVAAAITAYRGVTP